MKKNLLIIFFYLLLFIKQYNSFVTINVLSTGLFLPYSLGVLGYIKKNIPLEDVKITGVSGGSWCSVLYLLEEDLSDFDEIWKYSIGEKDMSIVLNQNIGEFQKKLYNNLSKRYEKSPIDKIKNLSIFTSVFDNKKMRIYNNKVSKFTDINDILNYCSCSSYIPYLSGTLMCKEYNNKYYMDGYITEAKKNIEKNTINIHRNMWKQKFSFSNILYSNKETSKELFTKGWKDTEKNKNYLLEMINSKTIY